MECGARLLVAALAAVLVAGCGSSGDVQKTSAKRNATGGAAAPRKADAGPAAVVRGWSDALRRSDVDAAADYFALPSRVQVIPGTPYAIVARHADAVAFNTSLPCGGRMLRADRHGNYVNALFLLSDRPGSTCDAPGGTARAVFLIRSRKIVEWRRAPSEPGDQRYERRKSPSVGPLV
ncbi:MAG: hypothetical protein QOI98_1039 [Solirubrobacteraceae bacterium]|jgi:hypothetical protein|nr:hypothetical protein [Solirubrobacteraceae bacterium]